MVAEVNGISVRHAAEGGGLHLPVADGVVEQTDAVVEGLLHPEACGAKVVDANLTDVVGMKVDNLTEKKDQKTGKMAKKSLYSEAIVHRK